MDLKEIRCEVVDWIKLAEDRAHWRALTNTIINLGGPYKRGIS
jgi:hypothetical protein